MGKKLVIGTGLMTLLILYLSTMALDLSWQNYGVDGGDLIVAAKTFGVAHPTGYPTYLLIARLFQWIPLGTLAYRTNLMSAVFSLLAAFFIYKTITSYFVDLSIIKLFAATMGALSFGLSQIVWSQSVITEVYTLNSLFIAVGLYSLSREEKKLLPTSGIWGGAMMGLAMGNHLTAIFIIIPWFITHVWNAVSDVPIKKGAFIRNKLTPFLLTSALIYASVFFRGCLSDSPVNWGRVWNFERFWWLISGDYYRLYLSEIEIQRSIAQWGKLFLSQLSVLGVLLAVLGLIYLFKQSKKMLFTSSFVFVAYFLFSFLYKTPDAEVLLTGAMVPVSIWVGLGIFSLLELNAKWRTAQFVLLALIFFNQGRLAFKTYPLVDASQDSAAIEYGQQILKEAPAGAILLTEADEDTFTLWYFHYGLEQRKDIAVLVGPLLEFDWYREVVAYSYPDLNFPDIPTAKWDGVLLLMNDRPVCKVKIDGNKMLLCMSQED